MTTEPTPKQQEEAREPWIVSCICAGKPEGYAHADTCPVRLLELVKDACDVEDRCRALLRNLDKSDSFGVVPLDEVVIAVLSSQNTEIRNVLEGLHNGINDCWCPTEHQEDKHSDACLATQALWNKLQPTKEVTT